MLTIVKIVNMQPVKDDISMDSLDWLTTASSQSAVSDLNLVKVSNIGAELLFETDQCGNQWSSNVSQ